MKTTTAMLSLFFTLWLFACSKDKPVPTPPVTPPVVTDSTTVQYGVPFANVPDRRDAVIYEVNMRTFSSAGNFAGVTARLDSIKALGVNVIYLMPVYPVGVLNAINSPYCVKDYKSINSEFGNMNDLRAIIDGAHARNMSVLLDWVGNHTAWDHSWMAPHKEWYLQNAAGNVLPPPGTGWNDVAQLNFNNAAMRLEMIKCLKYWVYNANIDGYRFDYADGPPLDFWKQAVDTLRNISTHKLLLLAEGGRNTNFTVGFDYNFGFGFFGNLKSVFTGTAATSIDDLNTSDYVNASNGQQMVRYTTNHDVNGSDGTPLELFGGQPGSMSAFVIAAYMKGVPFIYAGQEVGTPYRLTFPFTGADIDWSLNPGTTAEYKKLIAFRTASAAIRRGALTSYTNADVCVFTKEQDAEKVLVFANVRNSAASFSLPAALVNTNWKDAFSGTSIDLSTTVSLQPYEYLVLKNN